MPMMSYFAVNVSVNANVNKKSHKMFSFCGCQGGFFNLMLNIFKSYINVKYLLSINFNSKTFIIFILILGKIGTRGDFPSLTAKTKPLFEIS